MSEELKRLAIEDLHVAAGAKMVPFGGWNMPVQYSGGILAEHEHTRTEVSLFDCSHMGQFRLRGSKVPAQLDALLPRVVSDMEYGTCRYNFLLTDQGTVVDDCIVYRVGSEHFYIVVNAGTCDKDAAWFRERLGGGTSFANESADTAKFDIQGPKAFEFLEFIGVARRSMPKYYQFTNASIGGIPCLLSRTGYTGERGVELYFSMDRAAQMWGFLMDTGAIQPAGLGCRDTLRLEMGYPLYGHEMDEQTTPIEAGFGKMVNMHHDFVGRGGLMGAPTKELIGVTLESKRAAREGAELRNAAGEAIGTVSSGSVAPSLGVAVAMAYVTPGSVAVGDAVIAAAGRSELPGTVVSLPFYKSGTARKK